MNLSQQELSEDIMSQSNYSKIEKGEIELSFFHMLQIVTKLNLTMDEFLWMHTNGVTIYSSLNILLEQEISQKNMEEVKRAINKRVSLSKYDNEILLIIDATILIQNNEWEKAKKTVQPIWDRLQMQEALYYHDLLLFNSILYIFPLETALYMFELVSERVAKLHNYQSSFNLLSNIRNNLVLMMIKESEYQLALEELDKIIPELINRKYLLKLSTAYIRKGYVLRILGKDDKDDLMKKGFDILEWTCQDIRLEHMKNEVKNYLK